MITVPVPVMRGLLVQPRATVQVHRWNGRETEPAHGVKRQGPNGFPPTHHDRPPRHRDPGAARRIATRIHIALRAFLRWVPALVPLAQERSLHSAGTRDCRYATPARRRSWKCTTPAGLPPSTTIGCVFLEDQVMRPGKSLRSPDSTGAISLRWCRRAFVLRARICSGPPRRRAPASRSGGAGRLTVRSSRSCR